MTLPSLLLRSVQSLSSVFNRVSKASIDGGKLCTAWGGGAFEGGLAEVTATVGAVEPLGSKPTDDEAMSSSLEVAASSLVFGDGQMCHATRCEAKDGARREVG